MLRRQSLKRSSFDPKSRPHSSGGKFRYFGDDSEVSQLANTYFKKSGNLLGTRFTDSSWKFSNISKIDTQSISHSVKESCLQKPLNQPNLKKKSEEKQYSNLPASLDKQQISQIHSVKSMKSQSTNNLKSQIGELTGRLKNLEGLLSTLAQSEIQTREQIRSLKKCVSQKSLAKSSSIKSKISYPSPSPSYTRKQINPNIDIVDMIAQKLNYKIQGDLRKKQREGCGCRCGGQKEKQQMTGIIFELYQQNKFYQNQISKLGHLKKSSVLQNKAKIDQLLAKIRNV